MKTIEVDLDTFKKLKNLKLRPDEPLSSVVGRLAVYSFDWEPLTEEFEVLPFFFKSLIFPK